MKSVEPDAICVPATTPMTSPIRTRPPWSNTLSASATMLSAESEEPALIGYTPQSRFIQWQTGAVRANAEIGHFGLYLETNFAVCPDCVNTAIAAISKSSAASAMDSQIVSEIVLLPGPRRRRVSRCFD